MVRAVRSIRPRMQQATPRTSLICTLSATPPLQPYLAALWLAQNSQLSSLVKYTRKLHAKVVKPKKVPK